MSLFGKKTRSAPAIRIEQVASPAPFPQSVKKAAPPANRIQPHSARNRDEKSKTSKSSADRDAQRGSSNRFTSPKKLLSRKRRPSLQRVESDSEDDGSTIAFDRLPNKRSRFSSPAVVDHGRQLLAATAFTEEDEKTLIHAVDIANVELGFAPAFDVESDEVAVKVAYPGTDRRERYELVYREGDFDPAAEIINVVKDVSSLILATANRRPFLDPENGFVRKLQRSKHTQSMDGFKSALASYNTELDRLKESGAVSKSIAAMKSLPFELVERVLIQVYDRAVSPKVELLRKYENGTDFIYGELKPTFVFDVLTEAQMTSDQVFVDLGSGVANVVLQAALQVGCESWGCEMMENACDLAEIQKQEFEARCRLWGLSAGSIKLERGDFRTNSKLAGALKRADVILVNNEVFTPGLNNDLINMFLDLKDGCRIVSLKSFLPQNHKITAYNLNNPVNLLDVTEKSYSRNSVSWKEEGGHYYVAIKNSRRLESYSHLT